MEKLAAFQLLIMDRVHIERTLARYLEMDAVNRQALIADIEETGCLRVFGYGSLIGDAHAPCDMEYPATLEEHRRDAVFSDRYYRGTPHRLGITLGIVPDLQSSVSGIVQAIRIGKGGGYQNFFNRILTNIYKLAARETSFNPIYAYSLVTVRGQFGMAKAVICGTDQNNPQFIGPTVERDGGKNLTFRQKAAIIASSEGSIHAKRRPTGLGYWRFVLDCTYKRGWEPEPHIKKLVAIANAYRAKLPEATRTRLEAREDASERADFDPRVFECDRETERENRYTVWEHYRVARRKLGSRDPVSPQRMCVIRRNMRELAAFTEGS